MDLQSLMKEMESQEIEEVQGVVESQQIEYDDDHHTLADIMLNDLNSKVNYVKEKVQYPFVIVRGIEFEFELSEFRNKKQYEDDLVVMREIEENGEETLEPVGFVRICLEDILALQSVRNYEFEIYQDENTSEIITDDFLMSISLM